MKFLRDLPYYKKSGTTGYAIIIIALMYVIFSVVFLCSCSTVTPNHVVDQVQAVDSSTPAGLQQANNGVIGWNGNDLIITENKRVHYNNLIEDYRLQYREVYRDELKEDYQLRPHTMSGTPCWLMAPEGIKALGRLRQWERNQRPADSIWLKTLNKVGI
jgi:hypothetical protein